MVDWGYIRQLSQMQTFEDVQAFEQQLNNLADNRDIGTLSHLMDLFDDKCPHYEVMYSLVHAVESYPRYDYVTTILKKLSYFVDQNPFWTDCLLNRMFNDKQYLKLFMDNIHLTDKETLLKLFEIMEKESPHHKDLIGELRKQLERGETSV